MVGVANDGPVIIDGGGPLGTPIPPLGGGILAVGGALENARLVFNVIFENPFTGGLGPFVNGPGLAWTGAEDDPVLGLKNAGELVVVGGCPPPKPGRGGGPPKPGRAGGPPPKPGRAGGPPPNPGRR